MFGKWASGLTALFVLLKIIPRTEILELLTMTCLLIVIPLLLISWIIYIRTFF